MAKANKLLLMRQNWIIIIKGALKTLIFNGIF